MIVSCPNCTTAYQVDSAAIGSKGRNLKCPKCTHIWWQSPPPPAENIASKVVIACPQCSRDYSADTSSIPPAGRNVRCSMCKHVWRTFPARPPAAQAPPSIAPLPSAGPVPLPMQSPATVVIQSAGPALPTCDVPASPRQILGAEALGTPVSIPVETPDDGLPWPPYRSREEELAFGQKPAETTPIVRRWPSRRFLAAGVAIMLIPFVGFGLYRYLIEPRGLLASNPFTALNAPHVDMGVDLRDVTYTRQQVYGLGTVLTVQGKLANGSTTGLPTPHAIQITLTDAKNAKLFQTAVKPTVPKLGPRQSVAFTTTIYNAPEGAMHLQVTLIR